MNKENDNTPSEVEILNEIKYSVAGIRKIVVIQFVGQIILALIIFGMFYR